MEELSTEEPQVVDAPDESLLPRLSQEIRLDDVSFSYIGEQVNVKRVSLAVDAGQNVASVDPSGCGMSTILNRVMRFYDPTEGSVNIDGRKELRMAEDAQKTNNPKLELRLKFPDAQERENFEAAFQDWYKEIKRRTVAQRLRAERGEAVDDGQLAAIEDDVEGDFYEGWPCKLRFEESGPLGTTLETWY